MLSAVGTHLGPGRAYSHPFAGPTGVPPALLPPNSLNTLPTNLNSALAGMSATEFARPLPKPRYNGGPVRNISGNGSKFSEQNAPVNLVTNSTISSPHSPKDDRLESHQLQSKSDIHASAANSIYPPSRMPYGASPTVVSNTYREIDYTNIYNRAGNIYGTPHIYSAHALAARGQMQRNVYLASQLDSYQPFLPPFNPPNTLGVLPPQVPLVSTNAISSITTNPNGLNGMICTKSSILGNENSRHQSAPIIGRSEKLEKDSKERSLSASASSGKTVGFKIPSGKEGSMKHRILKGPYTDKDVRRKSPNSLDKVTLVRPTTNNNIPTNFSKGQLVEVAHGELKRIEDLRTEDFIMASEKTQNLQVIDTTVVKITTGSSTNVAVTLIYGNHRKKVEMEVNPEQPFYVYGQGWASCNPEASMQYYGLKCQQLQVGDVCISLYTQTPQVQPPVSLQTSVPQPIVQHSQLQQSQTTLPQPPIISQPYYHYPYYREDVTQLPQNLSRRSNTVPTTATGTAVTSRPVSHMEHMHPHQSLSSISYTSHVNDKLVNSNHPNPIIRTGLDERRPPLNHIIHSSYEINGRSLNHDSLSYLSEPKSSSSSSPYIARPLSNNDATAVSMVISRNLEEESLELSNSRKRRWSAPDNICDDEGCQINNEDKLN